MQCAFIYEHSFMVVAILGTHIARCNRTPSFLNNNALSRQLEIAASGVSQCCSKLPTDAMMFLSMHIIL